MARGGARQPKNPAAVSVPGSGRRTDGGAGSKSQPLRVASGGAYGERQAAVSQQQAAPMAAGGPSGVPSAGSPPQGGSPDGPLGGGAFGPTERPAELNTAGADVMATPISNDPQAALRHIMAVMPHPNIERMLAQRREYR